MKKLIVLIVLVLAATCYARTIPAVGTVDGSILHTIQMKWQIAETENSGDTQANAWANTERTKKISDALIAANAANETHISTFTIPSEWNSVRFRAAGITNAGTATHLIYFGTLGGAEDCELTLVGQFDWVMGQQQTIYDQIAFTSGGPYEPMPEEVVTGVTSGETAVVVSKTLTSGTWAGGDAAGTITYRSASGTFTGSEKISIVNRFGVTQADVLTHAATDLIDFEFGDTLVITAASWGSSWSVVSPADDTVAEGEIDKKGADYMVIITTATNADTKLLVTGY